MKDKIYGGIYTKGPSKQTDQFMMDPTMTKMENKLARYYLWETLAHNLMLGKEGLVKKAVAQKILKALLDLSKNEDLDNFVDPSKGDVHENFEKKLTELSGDDAGWFHLARSRNDQALVDQRLFSKDYLLQFCQKLAALNEVLLQKAETYKNTLIPGFTHLRVGMPSSFGFWCQAYLVQILDVQTLLKQIFSLIDISSLGAGTSYGVNWRINPELTAKLLGFGKPFSNALGEINSRGVTEFYLISTLAGFFVILSRMMEDLIIWSMPELNLIAMAEEFTTGSSIMPQKMNPDMAEKIRSKSAKFIGNMNYVIAAMKGTPSGYNRDSAESKIAVIDTLEEALSTISIATDLLAKVVPTQDAASKEKLEAMIIPTLATKFADLLAAEYGIPFRATHQITGKAIALVKGDFSKLTVEIVRAASKEILGEGIKVTDDFIKAAFDPAQALKQYQYPGSPSPEYLSKINQKLTKQIEDFANWSADEKQKFETAIENLFKEVETFI